MLNHDKLDGNVQCHEIDLQFLSPMRERGQEGELLDDEVTDHADEMPLTPRRLHDLFLRPRYYFAQLSSFSLTPWLYLVAWCVGLARIINRLDDLWLRDNLNTFLFPASRAQWGSLAPLINHSWQGYWGVVFAGGTISALLIWWVGGWWYWLRLCWSDAEEPDGHLARQVYTFSGFIEAAPLLLHALLATSVFPSYARYQAVGFGDETFLLIFPFWALVCSYLGVRTAFVTTRWKTQLWFLVLPCALYLVFAAGMLYATAMATPNPVPNYVPGDFTEPYFQLTHLSEQIAPHLLVPTNPESQS